MKDGTGKSLRRTVTSFLRGSVRLFRDSCLSTFRRDVSRDVVNYFGDGFDRDKIKILMDFRVVFEIKCYDTV